MKNSILKEKCDILVHLIYKETKNFPKEEIYGLTSQLRRAIISVPANITEGKGTRHSKEFVHFLYIARASLEESKIYLRLSEDLGYIDKEKLSELNFRVNEVGKMINGLISYLIKN